MSLISNYIGKKRRAFWEYLESWQSAVYSMVVLGATMVVIFWASVFLYTSFYFTFMPQESVTWPIHFHYRSCIEEPGICSNPKAMVSVNDHIRGSQLMLGQRYRVVVDLDMPESITNQRIGMFLVSMDMHNVEGDMLRRASRSAMLRYKSPLLHVLSTFVFSPFLLYGLQEEKQTITVELFSQYEEDPVNPLWEVGVELESRHVELYSARLRIHATFTGLRYIMYHYPMTAAVVGIGICMVFLSAVVILSWYQFSGPVLFAQPQVRNFPNGQPVNIASQPKPSNENKAEVKEKKLDTGEPARSSRGDTTKTISPNEAIKTLLVKKAKTSTGETAEPSSAGASVEDQDGSENSEGNDFEVLSSTKAHEEDERRIRLVDNEEEDGECMLRHRVQSIVQIPHNQLPDNASTSKK